MKTVDEEMTHQFLMGLSDESFSNVHSQVLTRDPLPSRDTIFNIIQQEENHKHTMRERDQRAGSVRLLQQEHNWAQLRNACESIMTNVGIRRQTTMSL